MENQPEPTMVEFVLYNQWANQQLLTICKTLDDEILTTTIAGTYGSILDTFSHLLRAEAGFLKRIHGSGPQPEFDWETRPSIIQIADFATQVNEAWLETIDRVPPIQNVHEEGNGWIFDYQARLIFMSLVYHGVAHRTDITTFLNGRGISLPELDVWGYQEAYPDRFQAKIARV